ncbi:peptidase M16 [Alteromonas mediterranea]|uniref:Peptidase M16 n=1 Tax=Alteromonas mediterranea TaxID=314275 RepID=A0AAC9JAS6_9ALTE|nr:pitrilysin family protein [Alteromonas mediterranea]APD89261.1 peptidase M16 [Alteromonas mediterranea]APD93461.1 peptidase M16 [Alteromonas mediterranea]APD97085.1 peptidase M16 [Alteromonas mediterranea]
MSGKLALRTLCMALGVIVVTACQHAPVDHAQSQAEAAKNSSNTVSIPYEKYTLENGLTVILHEDHSDPLVHVDVTYHVGSAREDVGKSGFAHFFEHMMFQGSKHVADEQHFKVITESGGNLNGTTNTDRTNYFETVPANQLEKVLWLESDRMGYLLEAVDQTKFENQRETVKNERAQRVDNQPYGLRYELNGEALYPEGHPYSWMTIGYVEDLDRVNVNDLKAFFKRWYGPNNAVLTIGGDIDVVKTKAWIKKYFGEIPAGPAVEEPEPQPVTLTETRYMTLEDKVHLPLLQITYPTVYGRHEDEAPLDVLADILGGGKTSLFYKNLVKEGMAVQAVVSHPCRELACEFQLLALANPAKITSLSTLQEVLNQTLKEFETRGVTADDLARTKGQIEARTVFGLQSVSGKVSALAANETFYQTPDLIAEDIERYNAVTADDVMRVYNKYIKDANSVVLSVVPKGQVQLAAAEQTFERPVRNIHVETVDVAGEEAFTSAPSSFDRSVMPKAGDAPVVEVPDYWEAELANGIKILGVTSTETPTVTLTLGMDGGMLLDSEGKAGTAYLTALLMNETTKHYSNEALASELAKLGSSIRFSTAGRYSQVYVSTLTKHLDETLALLKEKLFNPAFTEEDFERMKERVVQGLQQQAKTPSSLARRARDLILFGEDNRVSLPDEGTLETVQSITLDDVKTFYKNYYSPDKASIVAVGNLSKKNMVETLDFIGQWQGNAYEFADYSDFPQYNENQIFLIDSPEAVQSVVYIVDRSLPFDATGEHFKSRLMNFPLGGAFNSRINLNLREDKGFTYGANSGFVGGKTLGWFEVSTDLTAANTGEGIKEILGEIERYRSEGVEKAEIDFMRNAFTLSDALEFETPTSKARFLRQLLSYGLEKGYREAQLDIINNIDKESIDALAKQYLNLDKMQIIVVGDKAKILPQLNALSMPIIELSVEGNTREALN